MAVFKEKHKNQSKGFGILICIFKAKLYGTRFIKVICKFSSKSIPFQNFLQYVLLDLTIIILFCDVFNYKNSIWPALLLFSSSMDWGRWNLQINLMTVDTQWVAVRIWKVEWNNNWILLFFFQCSNFLFSHLIFIVESRLDPLYKSSHFVNPVKKQRCQYHAWNNIFKI
jgi:hypothetical protein